MKEFLQTIQWLLKGHSIYRALSAVVLKRESPLFSGEIVDFGSGKDPSRTLNLLKFENNKPYKIITTDIQELKDIDYVIDLEKPLPFKDGQLGGVILSNCLYAIYKPVETCKEIARTLKKNGTLVIITPFIYRHTHTPVDYYRYSEDFFKRSLPESGFRKVSIYPFGGRFTSIVYLLVNSFRSRLGVILRIIFLPMFILALVSDALVPKRLKEHYHVPLGFVVIAQK